MSNTYYADWRSNTGYPVAGVGDLDDLKMIIGVGEGGRWIAYMKPGYFYDEDGLEKYQYISLTETFATLGSVSGSISAEVSFRPAWGPVIVDDINQNLRYLEHHNCYLPATSASWTRLGTTNVYYTTPTSGRSIIGVRDTTNIPLYLQASSGEVGDVKSYYLDENINRLFVYSRENPPERYIDYGLFAPQLKMREVVVEEGGGVVTASYKNLKNLWVIRGSSQQYIGTSADNVISHSLDTDVGDWVVLEYFIDRSFCLYNHQTILAYTSSSSGASLRVSSEGSIPEYPSIALQTSPVSGAALQFNPIYSDAFRTGFLYHSNVASSGTPNNLKLTVDKKIVVGSWGDMIKASVFVYDKDGLPVPQTQVTLTHNLPAGSGAVFVLPTPTTTTSSTFVTNTDNRGEIHWLIQAIGSGVSGNINLSALTVNNLLATGTVLNLPVSGALNSTKYLGGVVGLSQSNLKTTKGYSKLHASPHYLDGIPHNSTTGISIVSKGASTFQYTNTSNVEAITLSQAQSRILNDLENPFRIVGINEELGVVINSSDELFATCDGGQSPIVTMLEEV